MTKETILNVVSAFYSVDPFRKTRKREVVFCRQVCMVLLRKHTFMKVREVSGVFNQHHSLVSHSQKSVFGLCQVDPEVRQQIMDIESKLV